jgi:hypothetical protein
MVLGIKVSDRQMVYEEISMKGSILTIHNHTSGDVHELIRDIRRILRG